VIGSLGLVAFAPLLFKAKKPVYSRAGDIQLNVVSPYNEAVRHEFAISFHQYYREKKGKSVSFNWVNPSDVSETKGLVVETLTNGDSGQRNDWDGVDVLFGAGEQEFTAQVSDETKHFAKLQVFQSHKEWFAEDVIPASFTGERYYDEQHQWVGTSLVQFGICYNTEILTRLGMKEPESWRALADPQFVGKVALADPQKSHSMAKAFEMLLQQSIHQHLLSTRAKTAETPREMKARAIRNGWAEGLNLIQRISANARYFTDRSTKIPRDVFQGDAAVGMCVDFYGRTYHEKLLKEDGSSRLQWIVPKQGSSVSVDSIAVLRNAPEPDLAQEFVEFVLSERGQLLWNARVGTEYGPVKRSLRKLPIRRDMYTADRLAHFVDASALPYETTNGFEYTPEYTAVGFNAMRMIIRVMCIDVHDELVAAWQALIDADFPERATHHFHDVAIVSYERTMGEISDQIKSGKKLETVGMRKRLASVFRRNYQQTIRLAAQER